MGWNALADHRAVRGRSMACVPPSRGDVRRPRHRRRDSQAAWLPQRLTVRDTVAMMCMALIAVPAQVVAQSVLPTGGTVTHGSAMIGSPAGGAVTIDQASQAAIIDWGSFSVGQPNSVQFNNGAGATLNRVIGPDPSQIDGVVGASGSLYLINENGLVVGPTGRIQTGGSFVGSTRDITNEDFLNGGANSFTGSGSGDIVNQGVITSLGGDVVLIARQVTNSGAITAPAGTAALGAGNEVLLNDTATADGMMFVKLAADGAEVRHDGTIDAASAELRASGGNVYTLAGNRSGEIHAAGVSQENGRIFLTAEYGDVSIGASVTASRGSDGGDISIAGDFVSLGAPIDASGVSGGTVTVRAESLSLPEAITATATGTTGKGGRVDIDVAGTTLATDTGSIDVSGAEGGDIRLISGHDLMSSADLTAIGTTGAGGSIDVSGGAVRLFSPTIDASGASGGGQIRIGGEYRGGKGLATDELPNAQALAVTDATTIRADATGSDGDGGTVILWADTRAAILGDIVARPGTDSGDGGFVELSSGGELKFAGTASTGRNGRNGTVLLDPKNIVVAASVDQSIFVLGAGYGFAGFHPDADGPLDSGDSFGRAVSLDGTRLAVGAPLDDGTGAATGQDRGAVYLFTFADEGFAGGSLSGVIGSGYTGGNNINLNADGAAAPLDNSDTFGTSVSLDGTRLAVGATGDNGTGASTGPGRGAVYLFTFADESFAGGSLSGVIGSGYTGGNNINLNADGAASPLDNQERFGASVSLDGTRLAVGVPGDVGTAGSTGAVYLFTFADQAFADGSLAGIIGSGYTGGNNLNMSDPDTLDGALALGQRGVFGTSVSLDGTRLVVSAPGGGPGFPVTRSVVYLFTFTDEDFAGGSIAGVIGNGQTGGNNINLPRNVVSATNAPRFPGLFGQSVSLDGTRLAVGSSAYPSMRQRQGAVTLFTFADESFAGGQLVRMIGGNPPFGNSIDLNANGTTLQVGDNFGASVSLDGTRLAVGAGSDSGATNQLNFSGNVRLFTNVWGEAEAGDAAFATLPGADITLTTTTLTALLNAGNRVELQANNDITFAAGLIADNPNGDGGELAASAGRSILVNADITTDNGDISFIANALAAQTAHRDGGPGGITVADGVALNAGTGDIGFSIAPGVDATRPAGNIQFAGNNTVTAATVSLSNAGKAGLGRSVAFGAGSSVNLSGAGDAAVLQTNVFSNAAGAGLFTFSGGGRFLILADDWESETRGGLTGANRYNVEEVPAAGLPADGNVFTYRRQPVLTVTANDADRLYGGANPAFSVTPNGLVNGDILNDVLGGTPVTASTKATAASDAGTYAVTPAFAGAEQFGYDLQLIDGTLTVVPAPLTVTANDETRDEGQPNPAFSAAVTGLLNDDTADAVRGLGFFSTAIAGSPAGDYVIRPIGGVARNYILTRVDGVLTVVSTGPSDEVVRDAITDSVRAVETRDPAAGFSLAPVFNGQPGNGVAGGPGAGSGQGIVTGSIDESGGTQDGTGAGGDQITGRLMVEIEVEGEPGGEGAFSFQLPPDFSGCAGEGACDGIPDSVFFSSFAVAN